MYLIQVKRNDDVGVSLISSPPLPALEEATIREVCLPSAKHGTPAHTLLRIMDSPPECLLALTCEPPQSPPTLPSLDHSPLASPSPHNQLSPPHSPLALLSSPLAPSPLASSHSPDAAPYFNLSPFPLCPLRDEDEKENELGGAPPSPTPAVALFPGGVSAEVCSPTSESSPPATPSAPLPGFGALELALSSGQSATCSDELDLQLFQQKDAVSTAGVGGASGGPALRFSCHVCGKRFRFQSILSLHARAHTLDRGRRASALYRTGSGPTLNRIKPHQNHIDFPTQNHSLPNSLSTVALKQNRRDEDRNEEEEADEEDHVLEEVLRTNQNLPFLMMDEATPLTPPLTEDTSLTSPYSSSGGPSHTEESAPATAPTPSFRCHACKGKFRTASELARHVRILHNPYKCTLCPFSANQEESLAFHLLESHPHPSLSQPDSPLPPYTPRPTVLATPDSPVPAPALTPNPPPAPPAVVAAVVSAAPPLPAFRCDTCGQRFTQSWFLKGHMRKHKDSLDHKCQVCGRGFKEPWFLKNHMKVHLNKLGLKAGLGGLGSLGLAAADQPKGSVSNQGLNALYSSLLLAQRGSAGGGGGGRGGRGKAERDGGRSGSGKSAILGYLGLPGDGGGASCMERLQAVAQVAEMGNGGIGGGSGGGREEEGGRGARGGGDPTGMDGGEQAAMWQLVARSLMAAQQAQQSQQQQRSRGQQHRGSPRTPSSLLGEADQVRAYLGSLETREEAVSGAGAVAGTAAGMGGPWECPDCGKLFRSLQQVVVHARVHTQRPQKGNPSPQQRGGGGDEDGGGGGGGRRGGRGRGNSGEPKHLSGGSQHQTATGGFHSVIASLQGENGLTGVSSGPSGPSRERVRGTGVKDCPYCGKAFRSSHHLKVHLRVHTGERPYKCPHCDYAGTQSGSLKYHLQRHHREQRNALAASSASSSSSPSLTSTTTTTTSSTGASSSSGAQRAEATTVAKQRRPQAPLSQGLASRGPAEAPSSRRSQPWILGLPEQRDQKSLGTLREADLESQYRYLSGVMGALYQGGLGLGLGVDGRWTRDSPSFPPLQPASKAPKVSRRKPLTTSRMVPSNGHSGKGGSTSRGGSLEGGFEPLDLSRRPSPGLGGLEEDGGGAGGVGGAGVTLSQCLFCPFRTSSAELMAMHLQVNHTSKSRRKRGAPPTPANATEEDSPRRPPQPQAHPQPDPLALWRYLNEAGAGERATLEEWASTRTTSTLNGVPSVERDQVGSRYNHQPLSDVLLQSSTKRTSLERMEKERKMEQEEEMEEEELEEEEEEEEEEEMEEEGLEPESSSAGESPRDGREREGLSLSPPALGSDHMPREEGGVMGE